MKRISTARQWNETPTRGWSDPEMAAMRRMYQPCHRGQRRRAGWIRRLKLRQKELF